MSGSIWRKWDLHFHTQSSYDYRTKNISDNEIIDILHSKRIEVIAITDHHLIDTVRIRKLQELGKGKITVLPGIEFRAELGGSESIHFIGIFSEKSNIEDIWIKIQSGCGITSQDILVRGGDKNIHCDFKDTCNLIHQLGGIISVHAGDKANSIENITNTLPYKMALKKELVINHIDILELGKVEDQNDYIDKVFPVIEHRLPMIICSDNHEIKKYEVKQNLWIKADPTFEGLKQVLFEPILRIAIQENLPEDKSGYQVINKIEIDSALIFNKSIELNPNLNSIIGGRSTGKSVLLAAIAKKLKTDKPIKFDHNLKYDEFVSGISKSIKVYWKDGQEEDNREIEYFEQGYMYDLARREDKLSLLIQDILRQKGKEVVLNSFEKALIENKKKISNFLNDLFQILKDISDKENKIRDKGDKKGIEDELIRLNEEMSKINNNVINAYEKDQYSEIKDKIEDLIQYQFTAINDISAIESLKQYRIFKENISYELISISEPRKLQIETKFENLKNDFESKWKEELELIKNETKLKLDECKSEVEKYLNDEMFVRISKAYSASVQLSDYEDKIGIQKTKLFEITNLLRETEELNKQKEILINNIKTAYNEFKIKTLEIIPELSDQVDDLKINAISKINIQNYKDILNSSLDQRSIENQPFFNFEKIISLEDEIFKIFHKLLNKQLILKGGSTFQNLATRLLTENFYKLNYDLEYDGDDFLKMSDGKKAFVVLKLLLDFSNKNCPILIDQPEDDLDNRAIFKDLVQYLRKKKILRQIILATHNPNIVVGADSELVIVANQNGSKNYNKDNIKFQYITGSLENTFKDNGIKEVLESKGIREHVCEILEGGDIAFKKREKQYGFKSFLA